MPGQKSRAFLFWAYIKLTKRSLRWNRKKEKFKKDDEANALLSRSLLKEWEILT